MNRHLALSQLFINADACLPPLQAASPATIILIFILTPIFISSIFSFFSLLHHQPLWSPCSSLFELAYLFWLSVLSGSYSQWSSHRFPVFSLPFAYSPSHTSLFSSPQGITNPPSHPHTNTHTLHTRIAHKAHLLAPSACPCIYFPVYSAIIDDNLWG